MNTPLAPAERFIYSARNYWVGMVCDPAAAAVLFVFAVRHRSGSISAATAFIVTGLIAWSLLEYVFHRWLLHGRPSMARRSHARHHANGTALISTPALVAMAATGTLWAVLSMVLRGDIAAQLVFGLYAGYNYYALVHHLHHHLDIPLPYLRRLEQAHHIHHARHTVNYGVTTLLWDRVFGTFQPPSASGK